MEVIIKGLDTNGEIREERISLDDTTGITTSTITWLLGQRLSVSIPGDGNAHKGKIIIHEQER